MTEIIHTTLLIDNNIYIDSYYQLTTYQVSCILDWYNEFNSNGETIDLTETITISPETFHLNVVNISFPFKENTSNLLEFIPELCDIFTCGVVKGKEESDALDSDEELFTETEKAINLMDAHIKGNHEQVAQIIGTVNNNNIVKTIRKNTK